jgi:membrane-bound serine protease (ClpP class)
LSSLRLRPILALVLLLGLTLVVFPTVTNAQSAGDTGTYYRAHLDASINPVTASFVERAIKRAEKDDVAGLIIQLDTPGGLMESMKSITDNILAADVPVVVWVGPAGARATSAGVFITYSAHVAAMAEGTNIGAAHPVQGGGQGEMSETMKEKVVNDAVAQLTGLARKRDRNETMASDFIRESRSINAREAVQQNVVNFMANDISNLTAKLAGRSVSLASGRTVELPQTPTVTELPMTWKEDFLNTIVNPNLVYILLMLGIYGLIYEFSNPGVGLGLVVGGICLLLGMFGMSMLPISYTGLGLIFLGIALMILDIFIPTFGVLTIGGLVSFVLGSVMLFETEAFAVSYGLIAGVTAATVTFILIVGYLVIGSFNKPVAIGDDSLVGRTGTVKETLDPEGMVYVWGEYWKASSRGGDTIETGDRIEVVEKEDRRLLVDRPREAEAT